MHDASGFRKYALTDSGWLESSGAESQYPVLWLPLEYRGQQVTFSGRRVVVGGITGAVTILELTRKQDYWTPRQTR
jgi:hypothetical protein